MRNFPILFVFILLAGGCSDKGVRDVWTYIQDRPDSALCVLNGMDASRFRGRTLAEFQLLKAMALDKNYINVTSDSLSRGAYAYFHRHGPREKEMLSLYYMGMSQYYAGGYAKAIVSLEDASLLARRCGNPRYEALSQIHLSHLFYAGRNYEDAIQYALNSIACFSCLPDSSYHIPLAKMHLAECYLTQHRFQDINDLLGPMITSHTKDTALLRDALPFFAWNTFLLDESRASEAVSLFEEAVGQYGAQLNPYQYHHYAVVLLGAGDTKKASAIQAALAQYPEYAELGEDLRCRLLKRSGNYAEALAVRESLVRQQNELALQTMSQALVRVQRDYQAQAREEAVHEADTARERLILVIIVFVLILLLAGVILRHRHRAWVLVREQLLADIEDAGKIIRNSEDRNKVLESELEAARMRYISAYKKQFQKLSSLVEYYHETSGRKDGRDLVYKQVMELSSTVGRDRQRMKALERSVNQALDNALNYYKEDYPGQDQKQYDFVCYLMAGLPGSLIQMLTGIPRNTIYSKKRRLLEDIRVSDKPHRDLLLAAIQ